MPGPLLSWVLTGTVVLPRVLRVHTVSASRSVLIGVPLTVGAVWTMVKTVFVRVAVSSMHVVLMHSMRLRTFAVAFLPTVCIVVVMHTRDVRVCEV